MQPYLKDIFADLVLKSDTATIDRITFENYVNLPGIMSDRIFSIMSVNNELTYDKFTNVL